MPLLNWEGSHGLFTCPTLLQASSSLGVEAYFEYSDLLKEALQVWTRQGVRSREVMVPLIIPLIIIRHPPPPPARGPRFKWRLGTCPCTWCPRWMGRQSSFRQLGRRHCQPGVNVGVRMRVWMGCV